MKQICFLFFGLLFVAYSAKGQRRNDSVFHAIKVSKEDIKIIPIRVVPDDFYALNVGYFCKKEIQAQKVLKVPVKFRLGSLNYTDALEGKSNSWFYLRK